MLQVQFTENRMTYPDMIHRNANQILPRIPPNVKYEIINVPTYRLGPFFHSHNIYRHFTQKLLYHDIYSFAIQTNRYVNHVKKSHIIISSSLHAI